MMVTGEAVAGARSPTIVHAECVRDVGGQGGGTPAERRDVGGMGTNEADGDVDVAAVG